MPPPLPAHSHLHVPVPHPAAHLPMKPSSGPATLGWRWARCCRCRWLTCQTGRWGLGLASLAEQLGCRGGSPLHVPRPTGGAALLRLPPLPPEMNCRWLACR